MKVLLVEDDREKLRSISECLFGCGIRDEQLKSVGSVVDAKRELVAAGYDLLILDINLPKRADQAPEKDGGLEVLRWLKGRGKIHCPNFIVGTTAFEDSHRAALDEFDNLIWSVVRFSHQDNAWRGKLASSVQIIEGLIAPPFASDGVSFRYDLAIITALAEPELSAVRNLANEWTEVSVRHDATRYFCGHFIDGERRVSFVACAASDKGMPAASAAATKLIYSFRPRYLAMVGICAGVSGRTKIGDVLVADPAWDWGSGKFKEVKGQEEFIPAAYQLRLDESLRNKAESLSEDEAFLNQVRSSFSGNRPENNPAIRIGPLPSGGSVLQSSAAVQRVIENHKDVIGIEMEIYAVMFACHTSPLPRPTCIGLKGVCDFGDQKKDDNYQAYAAYTSVAALKKLMFSVLE